MELDPRTIGSTASYKLLIGCVVPRPIAWVSTIGADGLPNLAPRPHPSAGVVPASLWRRRMAQAQQAIAVRTLAVVPVKRAMSGVRLGAAGEGDAPLSASPMTLRRRSTILTQAATVRYP